MIYPIFNCNKVVTSTIAPHEHFKRIEQLDLNGKVVNKYNLVSSLETTEPLVVRFRNQRNLLNKMDPKYFSSSVTITFLKADTITTMNLLVKSNPIYFFLYAVLFLGLIISISANGLDENEIGTVVFFMAVAIIDWFTKRNILSRVKSIIEFV